ncbi:type II and III secretion system protein family protein [Klebsiella spallanzanii]|uniref:type II and III secretion system protein family protein n=1 Tax=Klebsiella spallanzanii TaxID=2587528 RepID=UPI0011593E6F|nr:pilus assembly protein N-terminal domain-containing protein [Klebsiella spallanzanii]VUS64954.1 Type II secretion system protein D [Klebsiella spallanzanii]
MLRTIKALSVCVMLHGSISVAFGAELTMKEGQSTNVTSGEKIDTVFISNPAVADYKVIGNKKVVLFAKSYGVAEITLYGANAKVLKKVNISVDGVGSVLTDKVNKQFPGTKIQIERYMNGAKLAYVIKGDVATEELRDQIYETVGSLVGENLKEDETKFKSAGDDGAGEVKIHHLTKNKWNNVIDRMTVLSSPQQVNVKLTVVEVTKKFTDALGIEWSSLTLDSIINGGSATNAAGVFSLIGFKGGFDASNISTLINAVKNDSIARVLAQPNLTVLSGEVATFLVGGEIPIVIDSGGSSSTSVQYKEYGIRLNIGAKVNRSDKIRLFIANELSNVTGSYTYNSYSIPTINTRRTQSTIELADGDSFVIGGLLSESDRESLAKVPFIGEIPILGAFARSSQTEREKSELVVFATVKLVKPVSASNAHQLPVPQFHKTSVDKLFFNVGVAGEHKDRMTADESGKEFLSRGGFIR